MSRARAVRRIPDRVARSVALSYGYDQVIVIGRRLDRIGVDGEDVASYGRDAAQEAEAQRLGELARRRIMGAS